ncbi:14903_t:CDS:2 [Funneliformis geosporum]|uniref:14903_t:CDS:1 n=1 Tax=Funneliformis geosporum TaxID=1117311 RepID=A0A9W4SRC0_9GLOM|nr:14903_t:CDS:2 [Funneliformis geosporum]
MIFQEVITVITIENLQIRRNNILLRSILVLNNKLQKMCTKNK